MTKLFNGRETEITGNNIYTDALPIFSAHELGGATKEEPGTIRVGGERLVVITRALIATAVTQRATRCHYQ